MEISYEIEQEVTKRRSAINRKILDGLLDDPNAYAEEMLVFASFCKENNLDQPGGLMGIEMFDFEQAIGNRNGGDSSKYKEAYKNLASK